MLYKLTAKGKKAIDDKTIDGHAWTSQIAAVLRAVAKLEPAAVAAAVRKAFAVAIKAPADSSKVKNSVGYYLSRLMREGWITKA